MDNAATSVGGKYHLNSEIVIRRPIAIELEQHLDRSSSHPASRAHSSPSQPFWLGVFAEAAWSFICPILNHWTQRPARAALRLPAAGLRRDRRSGLPLIIGGAV